MTGPAGQSDRSRVRPEKRTKAPPYVDDWAEYLQAVEGKAARTVETYRERVELLLRGQEVEDPGTITFETLEAHMKRLFAAGRAESTRALAVAAFRSFCRYLGARRIIEDNPARELKAPKPYRREKTVLTRDEVKRLVWDRREGAVPTDPYEVRNRAIFWALYICGLRRGEIPPLRRDHLEWHQEDGALVYSVLVREAKASRRDVRMFFDPEGSRLLAHYLQAGGAREQIAADSPFLFPASHGGMLSGGRIYQLLTARMEQVGIRAKGRRLSPHILRHSIATHLLEVGWDVRDVQDFMRHRTLETTAGYLHTASQAKRAQRLNRMHPIRSYREGKPVDVRRAMSQLLEDL